MRNEHLNDRLMKIYQCRTIVPIVQKQLRQLFYNQQVRPHLPLALNDRA